MDPPIEKPMGEAYGEAYGAAYGLVYRAIDVKKVLMLQHKLSNPRPAKQGEHWLSDGTIAPDQQIYRNNSSSPHFGELGKSSHSDKSTILRIRAASPTGAPTRA